MDGHRVFETQDGSRSLFSERFGVSYHSKYGAWQETQHVFVDAGLRYAAVDRQCVDVLDIGYGTGLNAAATLRFAERRGIGIGYTAVDAYPVPPATLTALDYPTQLAWTAHERTLYEALQAHAWDAPPLRISEHFQVVKVLQRFEHLRYERAFDLVYYDAFAPEAQPELWTPELFASMYAALRQNGVLVTYCAKGQVKRDLRGVGFEVERLKGPPGKREMTRCTKPAA